MQRLRILVILILLSLMPLYSLAVLNEGQYAFRSLDINNGLSQNTVHAILQDKQGFMWFGTKDGLDRYDGISFRTFMKESGTLGNNFITSLYEDNLGQIWIGTDVGLYVYCPQMEKVRHFTLISNSNIDIDCTVNLITGDQKGGIWVVTQTRGIFYYNPQDSQLVNYQSDGSGTLNLKTSGQLYFDSALHFVAGKNRAVIKRRKILFKFRHLLPRSRWNKTSSSAAASSVSGIRSRSCLITLE